MPAAPASGGSAGCGWRAGRRRGIHRTRWAPRPVGGPGRGAGFRRRPAGRCGFPRWAGSAAGCRSGSFPAGCRTRRRRVRRWCREPSRSPGRRSQPPLVWWAIICATVQYMCWVELSDRRCGAMPSLAHLLGGDAAPPGRCPGRRRPGRPGRPGRPAGPGRLRAGGRGDPVGRQRLRGDHPGGHGGGEVLRQERPERLVFPGLDVPGGPVVEQAVAGDVVGCLADRDRVTGGVAGADPDAEFEFEVQLLRRPEGGCRRRRGSSAARWVGGTVRR